MTMWKIVNRSNGDTFRFDDAETCMAVFNVLKGDGYSINVFEPGGVLVNSNWQSNQ